MKGTSQLCTIWFVYSVCNLQVLVLPQALPLEIQTHALRCTKPIHHYTVVQLYMTWNIEKLKSHAWKTKHQYQLEHQNHPASKATEVIFKTFSLCSSYKYSLYSAVTVNVFLHIPNCVVSLARCKRVLCTSLQNQCCNVAGSINTHFSSCIVQKYLFSFVFFFFLVIQ